MKKKPRPDGPVPEGAKQSYAIQKILETRNSLLTVLWGEFQNRALVGKDFERLIAVVHEGLPATLDYGVVAESVRHLAGVVLTKPILQDTAHRLAGNLPRLRRFRPVPPWVVQTFNEWVPLQVMGVRRRAEKGVPGVDVTFKILAGTPCPLPVRRWLTLRYCRYLARHMEFSRPARPVFGAKPAKYPYSVPEQLVTMRLYGLIEPRLCKTGEPMFEQVRVSPSLTAWNREQMKFRFRVDEGYECPHDQPNSLACHNCPMGYTSCRAATHAKDYEGRYCPVCKKKEAPFDPDWVDLNMCVNCQRDRARHE